MRFFLHIITIFFCVLSCEIFAQGAEFEVYFPFDDDVLKAEAKAKLDHEIFSIPKSRIDSIHIFGHCDSLGGDEYNLELSARRVLSVKKYLISRGFELNQLRSSFYGRAKPKYSNEDEDERARNRRCEIVVYHQPNIPFYSDKRVQDLPLEDGESYVIPNLNFVGNQIVPMWYSFDVLNDLYYVMYMNPGLEVEIHGHVCCVNDKPLSDERAQFVYEFLLAQGISPRRMSYKGYGNLRPKVKETRAEEELQNRRVELKIIRNDLDQGISQEKFEPIAQISMALRGVDFLPGKAGLYPSARFMLKLLAESISESRGLRHILYINGTGVNERVLELRIQESIRQLNNFGCREDQFSVEAWFPETRGKGKSPDMLLRIEKH